MQNQELVSILIVDDNKNNLFTLHTLIDEHIANTHIIEADSGRRALDVLLRERVDLIILDVQMPDMDGFETATLIRSVKRTQHIPIVFLTAAYKSEEFKQRGFAIGAADYLTKPIDTVQLINRIQSYLRFIEQERQHNLELAQANAKLKQEINERKQAQLALEALGWQHESILASAGDGICGVDLEGKTTFSNPAAARMLGYSQEELIGRSQHALIHYAHVDGTPYPEEECIIRRAIQSGKIQHVDHEVFWRKDGTPFPVEYMATPIIQEGRATGIVLTFRDITERKKAEAALQHAKELAENANRAKSQFLANMSHELRTPLNAIIGYSEILKEEAEDLEQEDFIPDLDKIAAAGKHLLYLINDVLDISKIEAGKMELALEEFILAPLCDEVLSTVQPLLEKNGNRLQIDYDAECLGGVYCDLTKLRQVFLNLLSNASKFTENGEICFHAARERHPDGDWLRFSVKDNGIGMTPEQQARLFQPFSQADASTTRKYGGTGLGLAISKKFIEMMGGEIRFSSQFGHGTEFTVLLPSRVNLETAREAKNKARHNFSGNTALLINRHFAERQILQEWLSHIGYAVGIASNQENSLYLAHKLLPDLIILEAESAADETCLNMLQQLRDDPLLNDIPILFIYGEGELNPLAKRQASHHLRKPYAENELLDILETYRSEPSWVPLLFLIEDDTVSLNALSHSLTNEGWRLLKYQNGKQALENLSAHTPDLILLDLLMPEMDGFEFLSHLRADEVHQSIPVIIMTGHELSEVERMRLSGQVAQIFHKTHYNRQALLNEIRRILVASPGFARSLPASTF